jgi:phage gp36-like protein
MFITEADFDKQIRAAVLAIVKNNDTALAEAIQASVSEMQSYLRGSFDVGSIFSQTEGSRDPYLVTLCVDIALYHLHANIQAQQIPQLRTDRYNQAISWLRGVARGDFDPGLPKPVGTTGSPLIKVGGGTKRTERY